MIGGAHAEAGRCCPRALALRGRPFQWRHDPPLKSPALTSGAA